jgi:hypothetical protein
MFCANCRAEYRSGFTKCSDCGVDLVEHLPEDAADDTEGVPTDADGMELLWRGLYQGTCDDLLAALDAARIRYKNVEREFGLLPNLAQGAWFVWIDPHDRDSARAVLAKVLEAGREGGPNTDEIAQNRAGVNPLKIDQHVFRRGIDDEISAVDIGAEESDEPYEPTPEDFVEDFYPEEATCEVWAGDDRPTARFLDDCLRNVGIGCVVKQENGKSHVLVLPASEKRAREVIREIIEQTPPE